MKQYNAIKVKYPDALLLFRVGDFYETFGQDAIKTAKILGIILTKRGAGSSSETELAGFPHHSLNTYLPKLVKAGLRVAICDQLEDPKLTKTIVKRGVTELITPGLAIIDQFNISKFKYIAIEGNIGAGKTSLAKKISIDFNSKLILERFADNPFLPKFYEDPDRYAFTLEMSFLAERYQQITDDLSQLNIFSDSIVSDYDIFKSLIFL